MVGWNNRCLHKATRGRTEDVHCVCLSSQLQKPHHHHRRTRSAVVSSDGGWILGFILVGIVAWYSSTADPTTGWMGGVWALSTSSSSLTYRASIWVTKPKGYNFDGGYDKSLPPHSALIIVTTRFRSVALNAQPLEDDTDKSESVSMDTSLDPVALSVARTQPPSETKNDNDGVNTEQDYPLNVPSPLLLAGSMLFGTASTGSLFECIEGKVSPLNIWIAVAGFPTTIFLLIAAIQKGAAETREDDDRYMGGGGGGR